MDIVFDVCKEKTKTIKRRNRQRPTRLKSTKKIRLICWILNFEFWNQLAVSIYLLIGVISCLWMKIRHNHDEIGNITKTFQSDSWWGVKWSKPSCILKNPHCISYMKFRYGRMQQWLSQIYHLQKIVVEKSWAILWSVCSHDTPACPQVCVSILTSGCTPSRCLSKSCTCWQFYYLKKFKTL